LSIRRLWRVEVEANLQIDVGLHRVEVRVVEQIVFPLSRFVLNLETLLRADTKLVQTDEGGIDVHQNIDVKRLVVRVKTENLLCVVENARSCSHSSPPFDPILIVVRASSVEPSGSTDWLR